MDRVVLEQKLESLRRCAARVQARRKAVGFRNLAVHSYDSIDWALVLSIATEHLDDFKAFAKAFV